MSQAFKERKKLWISQSLNMRPAKAKAQLRIKSLRHLQTFNTLTLNPPVMTIAIYSSLLSLIFFTEISFYETPHNGASVMGMQCLSMSHKAIKQDNCLIPITYMYNENEILTKNEVKLMCNETIQSHETNGTMFLLGSEFARGRVC